MTANERFAGIALRYAGTDELKLESGGRADMPESGCPAFGFAAKGSARLVLRGNGNGSGTSGCRAVAGKVASGDTFYISPHTRYTLENIDNVALHIVWIRFRCGAEALAALAGNGPTAAGDVPRTIRLPHTRGRIADFLAHAEVSEPTDYYKLQSHLYAIAAAFVAHNRKPRAADDDLLEYVERTKRYMDDHYREQTDIEELARGSGASPARFYEAFRKHTGISPHKYMTAIRLSAALGMLAQSGASVTEVAHTVGYADELYFSRLFKKHMGMSPTEYAACAHKRIVMQPIFKGDLSVLGLKPEWELERGWWNDPEPHVRKIAETKPELVLTSPVPGELLRGVAEIAPIISVEWKGYPWKKRLLQMSGILGIASVAERWLAFYEQKVDNARRLVRRRLGDAPFLLVSSHGQRFRIYGMQMNKVKDLFYDDLGVTPAAAAESFGLLEVDTFAEAASFRCDNVLLLLPTSRSDEEAADCERQWFGHSARADAGRARCLIVRYDEPLLYNASTYESLVDQTVRLLVTV